MEQETKSDALNLTIISSAELASSVLKDDRV